jgi:hypothetical protein
VISVLANAVLEFLGSIAATLTVAGVRWSASALRARASRTPQSRRAEESEPG